MDLTTSVQFLPGVGPRRAQLLERLGVQTVWDLLWHLPRTWLDRSRLTPFRLLRPGDIETAAGVILQVTPRRIRGGRSFVEVVLDDSSGRVRAVWFNQPYLVRQLVPGRAILVSGPVRSRGGGVQFVHPEFELLPATGLDGRPGSALPTGLPSESRPRRAGPEGSRESEQRIDGPLTAGRIVPVYALTAGLTQKMLRNWVRRALEQVGPRLRDPLPAEHLRRLGLPSLPWALEKIHYPEQSKELDEARSRLAFDEFLSLQLAFGLVRGRRKRPHSARSLRSDGRLRGALLEKLPFRLTGGQQQVLREILADMGRDLPMNRLLQGDVGSGKTVVAVLACLEAVEAGAQVAYLAPTEILALQQAAWIDAWCGPLGVRTAMLIGRTRAAERRELLAGLATGEIAWVTGTHALLESAVEFRELGLVVVDEQHRFGVLQRARLREKGVWPHTLVMSATPIPRTLSLTLHGDLDVSWLRERPSGRQPPRTRLVDETKRDEMLGWIADRLREGERAFFVYPLVEESEQLDLRDASRMAAALRGHPLFAGIEVGLLHGRMRGEEKEEAIARFRDGRTRCLVTTTVVEVGVDIPRATIMVVEHPDRFGLSQLHQLRGRVGRGGGVSHVFLIKPSGGEGTLERLHVLVREHDGFRVAEEDLRLRGPGDLLGTAQHGLPELKAGDLIRDAGLLLRAREEAERILAADPTLGSREHARLRAHILFRFGERMSLFEIG